jgi:maltose/moltooligosaccharide transporter
MAKKPHLSFWQIWNMSFGFLGIQFGFALQNANTSRIFETLGANVDDIPILWIAAPLTGLIVQPIIGHMSDRTWGPLGRRRPFFLVGAILASIALIIMPNSWELWVAAGMLWIMDASINVSMEPFRAFVGDNLPDEQRTQGFAMQSFFIGTGAVVASLLPWMMTNWFNLSNTAPSGEIAPSVKFSFYCGGAIFFLAVLWTVLRSKEYSPEEMAAFEEHERAQREKAEKPAGAGRKKGDFAVVMKEPAATPTETLPPTGKLYRQGAGWLIGGALLTLLIYQLELGKKELYIVGFGGAIFGLMLMLTGYLIGRSKTHGGFVEVMADLMNMPKTMKQLAVVQFFSWFALFAMWIYSTNAVTRHYYDMNAPAGIVQQLESYLPNISAEEREDVAANLREIKPANNSGEVFIPVGVSDAFLKGAIASEAEIEQGLDPERAALVQELKTVQQEYNTGGDWIGVMFAVYNGVAALVAFLIPVLAGYINRRRTHMLCMLIGGFGLASVFLFRNPNMLLVSMACVGVAWASILSMPYAILSGALPLRKMGVYMGIFNFFIVIPQLVAASILGFLVLRFFGNDPIWALLVGGLSMALAGILTLRVNDATDTVH